MLSPNTCPCGGETRASLLDADQVCTVHFHSTLQKFKNKEKPHVLKNSFLIVLPYYKTPTTSHFSAVYSLFFSSSSFPWKEKKEKKKKTKKTSIDNGVHKLSQYYFISETNQPNQPQFAFSNPKTLGFQSLSLFSISQILIHQQRLLFNKHLQEELLHNNQSSVFSKQQARCSRVSQTQ